MLKYFFTCLLMVVIVIFITASSETEKLPQLNINKNDSTENIVKTIHRGVKTSHLKEFNDEIAQKKIEYLILRQELDSKIHLTQKRLAELKHESFTIRGRAPYLGSLYFRQLLDLQSSFNAIAQMISAFSEEEIRYKNFQSIRALIATQGDHFISSDDLKSTLTCLDSNIEKREEVLAIIQNMKKDATALDSELNAYALSQNEEFQHAFGQYALFQESFIGNQRGSNFKEEMMETLKEMQISYYAISMIHKTLLPDSDDIPTILGTFAFALIMILVFVLMMKRKHPKVTRYYVGAFWFFMISLYFQVLIPFLPSASDVMMITLTAVFFGIGAVLLASEFHRQDNNLPVKSKPIMWSLILNICFMGIIDLFTSFMIYPRMILAAIVVMSIFMILYLPLTMIPMRQDRFGFLCAGLLPWLGWFIGGILAFIGFLYPAIVMVSFMSLLGIALFIGQKYTSFLIGKMQNSIMVVFKNFIYIILIPMLWLMLFAGLILRIAAVINGHELLMRILEINIIAPSVFQITVKIIIEILIAGLIVKFILSYIRYIIDSAAHKHNYDHGGLISIFLIFTYVVWIGFGLTALSAFNFSWEHLKWILGGLSVGMGFALKDIVDNFLCGITLLIGKEARLGDLVEYDGIIGRVEKINIRATFIRTFDDAIITLPNSQMVAKDFKNWTLRGNIVRRRIEVGVSYGSDIETVKQSLLKAAIECEHVAKNKAPTVIFRNFGSSDLQFILFFWVHVDRMDLTASDIRYAIVRIFEANHIEIAFPQLDVHFDHTPCVR